VPKRAQYIRVIAAELQRIASHLLWLGTWCMDMGGALGGGATVFLYCIRERELILDLFESLVGARLLYGLFQVGGVRYDLPDDWPTAVSRHAGHHRAAPRRIRAAARGQTRSSSHGPRASATSRASWPRTSASRVPLLRGSGVNFDLRRNAPYSAYGDFTFTVPVETDGDCFARYRVADGRVPAVHCDRATGRSIVCLKGRSPRGRH
jgi:NADH:ubiquinone oxidoreductase subunit D